MLQLSLNSWGSHRPYRGHEGVRGWLGTGTGTVSPDRQGAGPDSARGSCSGEPGRKAPRPCPWQRTLFTPCTCLQAVRLKTLHGKHPSVPGTVLGSDTGELPAQQAQDGNSVPPVFIAPAQQPSNNGPRGAAGTVGMARLLPAPNWDPSGATNSQQGQDKATAPRLSPVHPARGAPRCREPNSGAPRRGAASRGWRHGHVRTCWLGSLPGGRPVLLPPGTRRCSHRSCLREEERRQRRHAEGARHRAESPAPR